MYVRRAKQAEMHIMEPVLLAYIDLKRTLLSCSMNLIVRKMYGEQRLKPIYRALKLLTVINRD